MQDMRYFWDNEMSEVITEERLKDDWDAMEDWERAEYDDDYNKYFESCQDYNGGVLMELDDEQIDTYRGNLYEEYYWMCKEDEDRDRPKKDWYNGDWRDDNDW